MAQHILNIGNKLAMEHATEVAGRAVQEIFGIVGSKGHFLSLKKRKNPKELEFKILEKLPLVKENELETLLAFEKKLRLTWTKKPEKGTWEKFPDAVDGVLNSLRTSHD